MPVRQPIGHRTVGQTLRWFACGAAAALIAGCAAPVPSEPARTLDLKGIATGLAVISLTVSGRLPAVGLGSSAVIKYWVVDLAALGKRTPILVDISRSGSQIEWHVTEDAQLGKLMVIELPARSYALSGWQAQLGAGRLAAGRPPAVPFRIEAGKGSPGHDALGTVAEELK